MEIRRYLAQGKPLLFDGAMGTCYAALPGRRRLGASGPAWIIRRRSRPIHTAYLEAGSRAVKTNILFRGRGPVPGGRGPGWAAD